MELPLPREHMLELGCSVDPIRWLMQFQADVLGVPVIVPEVAETTALGAAMMAGVGAGLFTESDAATLWRERARYEPQIGEGERERLLGEWHRAVERSRGWAGA